MKSVGPPVRAASATSSATAACAAASLSTWTIRTASSFARAMACRGCASGSVCGVTATLVADDEPRARSRMTPPATTATTSRPVVHKKALDRMRVVISRPATRRIVSSGLIGGPARRPGRQSVDLWRR